MDGEEMKKVRCSNTRQRKREESLQPLAGKDSEKKQKDKEARYPGK
jgi:hypothetical protein